MIATVPLGLALALAVATAVGATLALTELFLALFRFLDDRR